MIKTITLLAFMPGLFGFGSKLEAQTACNNWVEAGVIHEYVDYYSVDVYYTRAEAEEIATRIAYSSIHDGKTDRQRRSVVYDLTQTWMKIPKTTRVDQRPAFIRARRCELETATNQYLGLESSTVRQADDWDESTKRPTDYTVSKRFRF